MKTLYFLIIITLSFAVKAKEINPDLYQTWYLVEVYPHDGHPAPYVVHELTNEAHPYITINEDLTYSGQGVCNTFGGTFQQGLEDFGDDALVSMDFFATELSCQYHDENQLENAYFGVLSEYELFGMQIVEDEYGLILSLNTPPFGWIVFNNYDLATQNVNAELAKISIYPNPSSEYIQIQSSENVQSITIFNSQGKMVLQSKNPEECIFVNHLPTGLYFLKIKTDKGVLTRNFLKK